MLGPPFPSTLCWCWCIWWTFAEEYKNKDCAIYPIGGYNEYYKKSIKKSSEDLGLIKLSPIWATASIDEIDSWKIEEIRNFGIKYLHRSCDAWLLYQPSGPGFDSGMSHSESAITRGKTQIMLLPPTSFSWTTSYVLTCLQDSWPEIAMKGFEPGTFGSVFWSKATEGQWLEVPRNFRANLLPHFL